MRFMGLLLLPAGWIIVISSMLLFPHATLRWTFAVAGVCIEAAGLALAFLGGRHAKDATE